MSDIITITNIKDGTQKTINLDPVHEYMSILNKSCEGKYPLMNETKVVELLELVDSLNKDQLKYLVNKLTSEVRESKRTIRYMHTKEALNTIERLRNLAKINDEQGIPFWENYNELRE